MGADMHRRSIWVVGMLAALTALAGVSAAALTRAGSRPALSVSASALEPVSSATASPPTTTTTTTGAPRPVGQNEPSSTSSSVLAATTTTTRPCRNSTNPACGPFRWDPDPRPNEPLDVSVTFTPAHPHVGEPVTFFVRAVDPDAKWLWGVARDFGDPRGAVAIDGSSMMADAFPDYCAPAKYGPWMPPPRRSIDETLGYPGPGVTHTYTAPGSYTARWSFRSDSTACGLHEPYGSYGSQFVEVVVEPAQASTTTTATR
jgi:hypothetical protein